MNDIGEFPCLFCHIDLSKWESAVRDGRGEERGWDIYLSVPVLRDHLWLDYNPGSGHNFFPSALSISFFCSFGCRSTRYAVISPAILNTMPTSLQIIVLLNFFSDTI